MKTTSTVITTTHVGATTRKSRASIKPLTANKMHRHPWEVSGRIWFVSFQLYE